ncbi:hypothetical protein EV356DRAFT_519301 [Viridothelium virens]|uniref:Uncharacterized protein n=1 Tax=Viridothelium virens TaxID=1048519 RepID=A0A6A6GZ99_VIRVR|nr:hypothetical protein EV356DRAFT_519301 [Viridothelium virens]
MGGHSSLCCGAVEGRGLRCEFHSTLCSSVGEVPTALLDLFQQAPHDEMNRQHQQRLIEKLANTAETSFAQHAPDQNHIQLQTKMNNQAKVRPSTRSSNPDEVEVTSYADLEGTRAKRAEKDPAKVVKGDGRRGRKGKSVAQELDTTEPEPNTLVQIDMTLVAEDAFRPEPWRAFVPRIW